MNIITRLLLNIPLRWLFMLTVMILNFIAYYQDPIRLSNSMCYFNLPCKWFSYLAGMGTFTMDVLTFLGLWLTIPFTNKFPEYWYFPLIILGYAVISQITIDSKTYKKNENLNPPPRGLWPKKYRVMLYTSILIIDIIIFMQFFFASGIKDYSKNTVLHRIFLERFGGFYKGNELPFIVAWFGIIGVAFDSIALNLVRTFEACKYELPNSWNF